MGILETTIAIIIAQIPTYFIQRYFFKKILDRHLDKIESVVKKKVKRNISNPHNTPLI